MFIILAEARIQDEMKYYYVYILASHATGQCM
jgi:hypothetical protein